MSGLAIRPHQLPATLSEFWELTKNAQSTASHLANERIRDLEHMTLEQLQRVLIHYRWHTAFYPGDLGILIYKLPPCSLRSALGEILAEELGSGDGTQSHLGMYDRFLLSIGVAADTLESLADLHSIALLEESRFKLLTSHYLWGVGLRGMGGECLCHVYLNAMDHYMRRNRALKSLDVDWAFWDLHAGEEDREHHELTRMRIAELATPGNLNEMSLGYLHAERSWNAFWDIAFDSKGVTIPTYEARRSYGPMPMDGRYVDAVG